MGCLTSPGQPNYRTQSECVQTPKQLCINSPQTLHQDPKAPGIDIGYSIQKSEYNGQGGARAHMCGLCMAVQEKKKTLQ